MFRFVTLKLVSLCAGLLLPAACSAARFEGTDIKQLWGAYSPFFTAGTYVEPPAGSFVLRSICSSATARASRPLAPRRRLFRGSASCRVPNYIDAQLDFLKNFTYSLGVADLVPFGAQQSFEAGELAFERYTDLISAANLPFVRSDSSARVVDSANNWTAGFSSASHHVYTPHLSVVLSENGNDTLDDNMCPNAGDSDAQTDAWLAVFAPPITARLNRWAPHANLTDPETYALISMCPFHTVAAFVLGGTLTLSPFCALFSAPEFEAFEYSMDLDKYYGTGYGAKLGRVQGVGYTNELLARLTNAPLNDSTQTNSTLDADPATFPLGRTLYADFSHDNEMVAVYSALGLFPQRVALDPTRLPTDGINGEETWVASRLVPFSARMVVERLVCEGERLQPLEFCVPGNGKGKGEGICKLDAFVESQAYAWSGGDGDWQECFA
ncbi:histidine phosphatase superfamily [Mycena epipterygia]|nr:histidine phosphatase superfamily [Mycena epipterygia]